MARLKKKGKTNVDPSWLFDRSWDENPHIDLRKFTSRGLSADYKKCKASFLKIVEDKFYNPYVLKIVDAEQWFAVELPGPEWEIRDGGETKQIRVRGYIDLVHEIDGDTIEIVDYKSGTRSSPFDKTEMDFYGLTQKLQARFYFMAARALYPQYKNVILTFYYTQDGPTTIGLSDEDIPFILSQLYEIFQQIKKDSLIRRSRSWKCKLCPYNKEDACTQIWSDLNTFGEEYVQNKYHQISVNRSN
jgi:hypothetical protein